VAESSYRKWADAKPPAKPKPGSRKKEPPKKKKWYCCNPYTFWLCRDYPSVAIICGIVALVVTAWIILYTIPVTDEQECPLIERSNCNEEGLLCDPNDDLDNPNRCEESLKCERIIARIEDNGRLEDGAMFCGPDATCMRCVNEEESL
jgi:hypothetical protein